MRSLELFAGAGGLGIGLHQAGFSPVSVIERDRYCCDTIRQNRERGVASVAEWQLLQCDVREIDFHLYEGHVALVSGGPPCQPFSLAGKHRAYADTRDMFPEAIRAVRQARPKAFIFENVRGLTRSSFRNYFEYIRLQLEHPNIQARAEELWTDHLTRLEQHHTSGVRDDLHYRVIVRLLNSADYGVPQRRERVVFVGFREDLNIEWSFPLPTHSLDGLLWAQAYGDYWERHGVATTERIWDERFKERASRLGGRPEEKPWRTVRDAIHDLPDPEHDGAALRVLNHRFQPGGRTYPGHTGSPYDEPAKTLKAGVHGVPGGENMLARPSVGVRYFTVRESARLQTFPDDFLFHGSWSETMRQLGNAVPVKLACEVGRSVARQLESA